MNEHITIVREWMAKGHCVPVVGAGASIAAGAPSWSALLHQMVGGLPRTIAESIGRLDVDPLESATLLNQERHRLRLAPVRVQLNGHGAVHAALAAWACPLYLTTNFDDGLEEAIRHRFHRCRVISNDCLDQLNLRAAEGPTVVKLCSSSRDYGTGALSREEFALLLHRERAGLDLLITILRTSLVVFVGCSMRDPLISAALNECYASGIGHGRHVVFLGSTDTSHAQVAALEALNVDVITFPTDDRTAHLLNLLRQCDDGSTGPHRLLVFEPGTEAKTRQVLEAINEVKGHASVARVGILTANAGLVALLSSLARELAPGVDVEAILAPNLADTQAVLARVLRHSTMWTALIAPYEYPVLDAARFVEAWGGAAPASLSQRGSGDPLTGQAEVSCFPRGALS